MRGRGASGGNDQVSEKDADEDWNHLFPLVIWESIVFNSVGHFQQRVPELSGVQEVSKVIVVSHKAAILPGEHAFKRQAK